MKTKTKVTTALDNHGRSRSRGRGGGGGGGGRKQKQKQKQKQRQGYIPRQTYAIEHNHSTTEYADQNQNQRLFCVLRNLAEDLSKYEDVWTQQKQVVETKVLQIGQGTPVTQDVFLVQHHPVYTLGAGSTTEHLKFDMNDPPFPIFRTERGGEVTYHGPGQLVMYPILDLRSFHSDLHWYMRTLEEVVIETLGSFGLRGERIEGLTGVWVDGAKVAAIGVRAKRWITYHGLALNVTTDLTPFQDIVPCGIQDRPVTSMYELLKSKNEGKDYDESLLLEEVSERLLESFSLLFDVSLVV